MTYSQATRPVQVETVLGPDAFLATGLTGEEEISRPFQFTVDLASEQGAVDPQALVGTPACVSVTTPEGGTRLIHGLVRRFRQVGRAAGASPSRDALRLAAYQAELVPWFWMLTLSSDCRIFQRLSVPDIVAAVFRDLGYADYATRLVHRYPAREYCVQYRESPFNFVSRLLEEEGIAYHFEHAADKHTLVLTDAPAVLRPCPELPVIRPERREQERVGAPSITPTRASASRLGALTAAPLRTGLFRAPGLDTEEHLVESADGDTYDTWAVERAVHTRAVALADYDYLHPGSSLAASVKADAGLGELFDYPGNFVDADGGDRYARLRLEVEEAQSESATGAGCAPALTSGYKIAVDGERPGTSRRAWLVVRVAHRWRQPVVVGDGEAPFRCETRFALASADLPWRPPRDTPRPRVRGTQSALVVGVAGEEIHTDAQGRVKLHFYWDRRGRRDENSSCWVRCSTAWAGKGWGQFSVPRVGQEVLVDFLEGDPDRPVVVGRVYNADQPPPCNPGGSGGAVSGMRSKSHRGQGYNAIEMHDAAGKEKISIHAQHDLDAVVENNETRTIVAGTQAVTVHQTASLTVQAGSRTVDVTGGNYDARATAAVKLHGKGAGVQVTGDAAGVTVAGNGGTGVAVTGSPNVHLRGTAQAVMTAPSAAVNGDDMCQVIGAQTLVKGKNALQVRSPDIDMGDGTVVIHGSTIVLQSGANAVVVDGSGVTIMAAKITSAATGLHTVSGAMVKIN